MNETENIPVNKAVKLHPVVFHAAGRGISDHEHNHNVFHGTKKDELNEETREILQLDLGVKDNRTKAASYYNMDEWATKEVELEGKSTAEIVSAFYELRWSVAFKDDQDALCMWGGECQHRLLEWRSSWSCSNFTEQVPVIKANTLSEDDFLHRNMEAMKQFQGQAKKIQQAGKIDWKEVCGKILDQDREETKIGYHPLHTKFGATVIILKPTEDITSLYSDDISARNLLELLRSYSKQCKEEKTTSGQHSIMDALGDAIDRINTSTSQLMTSHEPEYALPVDYPAKIAYKDTFDMDEESYETYLSKFPDPVYLSWEETKAYINFPSAENLNNLQYQLNTNARFCKKSITRDARHQEKQESYQGTPTICPPFMHNLNTLMQNKNVKVNKGELFCMDTLTANKIIMIPAVANALMPDGTDAQKRIGLVNFLLKYHCQTGNGNDPYVSKQYVMHMKHQSSGAVIKDLADPRCNEGAAILLMTGLWNAALLFEDSAERFQHVVSTLCTYEERMAKEKGSFIQTLGKFTFLSECNILR